MDTGSLDPASTPATKSDIDRLMLLLTSQRKTIDAQDKLSRVLMANLAQHPMGLELRLRQHLSNLIEVDRSGARRKLQHKQEVCNDPGPHT
jgi:hypothetical protein